MDFLTGHASEQPTHAGALPGIVGSLYLVALTGLIAFPLGVGAAIHLEEFGGEGRLSRLVEINIANLAGVPSIVYGLVGLEIFARTLRLGHSLLAGALTLALLVLPIVVIAAREAIRSVPEGLREAGLALGGTRWSVVRNVVVPMALPGILTGTILAIGRALGEAAPLLVLGALASLDVVPSAIRAPFTALPVQVFDWIVRPDGRFLANAAAGIVVLTATLVLVNAVAIHLRNRHEVRVR
jgi:phosphate transport system permease protein